jgi:hypothetical protein
MAKTLQFRRATTGNLASVTGAVGEIFIDTTKDTVVVMDGSTAGGFPLATEASLSNYQPLLTAGSGIDITSGTISATGGSYGNTDVASYLTSYTGNIGNVKTTANVVTSSYFIGDGSQLTGIVSSYGNANVGTYLTTYTGNIGNVKTTANVVTSGYFIGNGSQLTGITSSYTLPTANTTVKGGVIIPAVGTSGIVNNSGTISVASATRTQYGGILGIVGNQIALGTTAGATSQGANAIAVGNAAGYDTQASNAVAVGYEAGYSNQQSQTVAIGLGAGRTTQSHDAVAIGKSAGRVSQGSYAIAIGSDAGYTSQGIYSIAIGMTAGETNQPNNSIVLNARGTGWGDMTGNAASAFYVDPVRNNITSQTVYYNTTTKEISYGNSSIAGVGVTITSPSAGQVISYGTALGPVENTYTNYTTQYPAIEELPGAVNYSITNDVSDSNNLLLTGTFPESFYSKFTVGQQFKYKLTYWLEDIYEVTSVTTTNSTTIAVGVTWISSGSNMMGANLADFYSNYFKFTTNQSVPQWINANAAGGGGSSSNSFANIAVSGQSNVVADSSTDILTLVAGSGISITTDAGADSITIAATGGGGSSNSFANIAVSGQSNVVADSSTDILTLAAGSGISITTDAGSDTITIAASGGGGALEIDANGNFIVGANTLPSLSYIAPVAGSVWGSGTLNISIGDENMSAAPYQSPQAYTINNGSGYTSGMATAVTLTLFSGTAPSSYPTVDIYVTTVGTIYVQTSIADPLGTYGITPTTILTADFSSGTGAQFQWPLLSPTRNTVIGSGLNSVTSGTNNIALTPIDNDAISIGETCLHDLTTGSFNIGIGGTGTLTNLTTGNQNIAIGSGLSALTTGSFNITMGSGGGSGITTGSYNVLLGGLAGAAIDGGTSITTGSNNVMIGYDAGRNSGANNSQNTYIGSGAGIDVTSGTNNLLLGYNAALSTSSASNQVVLGNGSISVLRCQQTSITALSDARDKTNIESLTIGLDLLKTIRPVNFTWNTRDGARVGIKETGFIAQELKAAVNDSPLKDYLASIVISNEDGSRLEAAPNKLFPVMVKAIQELSEQNATLLARLDALETLINKGNV